MPEKISSWINDVFASGIMAFHCGINGDSSAM